MLCFDGGTCTVGIKKQRLKMPAGVTEKQLGKMVGNAMSVPVIEKLLVQISESAPGHSV